MPVSDVSNSFKSMKKLFFLIIFSFCAFSLFSKPLAIIMVGAPGSGKGTQSQLIEKDFFLKHISTGDLLRDHINARSSFGMEVEHYLKEGVLVPDDLILNILWDRLTFDDCKNGFIIDGSSRNINQAMELYKHLNEKYQLFFIILQVPDDVILNRLRYRLICKNCNTVYHQICLPPKIDGKCDFCNHNLFSRDDDKEEIILKRLNIFHAEFIKLQHFYSEKQNAFYIDGNCLIDEVYRQILTLLSTYNPIAKAPN